MALIDCTECGKQISDKASACPGCGCPSIKINSKVTQCKGCGAEIVDINDVLCNSCGIICPLAGEKIKKEILLSKAIDIQLKYKNDYEKLQNAVNIYKYIIDNFGKVDESYYAISNLKLLYDEIEIENELKNNINKILCKNNNMIRQGKEYRKYNSNCICTKCNSKNIINLSFNIVICEDCRHVFELKSINTDTVIDTNTDTNTDTEIDYYLDKIPLGMYVITGIIGFPVVTGFATGFYLKQKNLAKNGEYEKLENSIAGAKVICIGYSVAVLAILFFTVRGLRHLFY